MSALSRARRRAPCHFRTWGVRPSARLNQFRKESACVLCVCGSLFTGFTESRLFTCRCSTADDRSVRIRARMLCATQEVDVRCAQVGVQRHAIKRCGWAPRSSCASYNKSAGSEMTSRKAPILTHAHGKRNAHSLKRFLRTKFQG